jgi:hypothetical protein
MVLLGYSDFALNMFQCYKLAKPRLNIPTVGSSHPNPFTKPKATIEKIIFSKEDQEDIKNIMEGKPTKQTIERYNNRGWNLRHRIPLTMSQRRDILKRKFFGGVCHVNGCWPEYKVTYHYDGAILKEYYCEQHFKESGIK